MITPYSGICISISLLELSGLTASEELELSSVASLELEFVSLPAATLELETGAWFTLELDTGFSVALL
jgi:hypothetical protein